MYFQFIIKAANSSQCNHFRVHKLFFKAVIMPARTQHVCFTANNYTDTGERLLASVTTASRITRETKLAYLVYQKEVGESGTPHLQGYIQMERKVDIVAVTKFLQEILGTQVRTFEAMGSSDQASDYCKKPDTRVENTTPVEIGEKIQIVAKSGQGKRTDLDEVRLAIESGMSQQDLEQKFFREYAMYSRFLLQYKMSFDQRSIVNELRDSTASVPLRSWQQDCLSIVSTPPSERKVRWFWESVGNVGKSWMARYLFLHHKATILRAMKKTDLLYALTKTISESTVVVFDLTRSTEEGAVKVVYEVIEQILDRIISSGKYDSLTMTLPLVHVVVFANFEPDRTSMSADRWDVHHIGQPRPN